MPIVDIKGVGPAQFPSGMSVDDIRSFLQRKYSQRAINGQSDILQSVGGIAAPYEKTLVEKFGTGISDLLTDTGVISNRYGANQIGENLASIGEFLPGIGDATAGDEFGRAVAQGDKFGMAMAGLGAIPVAGDALKKSFKGANPVNIHDTIRNRFKRNKVTVNLPQGNAGSSEFERIKDIDPKAKVLGRQQDGTISVQYLNEYQPKQVSKSNPNLFEFDPDALEITENEAKRINNYKGRSNKPISVTKKDGDYFILDGHHRAKIAKQNGESVKAVVIPFDDVDKMKKENIHQGDMFSEWVAKGDHNTTSQSLPMDEASRMDDYSKFSDKVAARREAKMSVYDMPTKGNPENIKHITDLTDYTPEQLVNQLKVIDNKGIKQGGYLKKGDGLDVFYKNNGTSDMIDPKSGDVVFTNDIEQTSNLAKNDILELSENTITPEQRKIDFDKRTADRKAAQAREDAQNETYKMQHTAPMREDNSTGYDLTSSFGDDIYTGNAVRYFGGGTKDSLSMDTKAVRIIQGMKGKPEKSVTIYRAVPKNVKEIHSSDWVTTTKEYAQGHMEGEEGWHILSKKVKVKDIASDGNSIHEFGYDPEQ